MTQVHFSIPTHHPALVTERLFIRKIRMDISISIQHITFPTNPPTQTRFGPFSSTANFTASFPHPTGPPGLFGHPYSPVPADTLLGPKSVSSPSQPVEPPFDQRQPKYMTRDGSASWNSTSTFNPLTSALLVDIDFHILRCARHLPLNTSPKTAFITQHRLNAQKFNTIISSRSSFGPLSVHHVPCERVVEADLRSGDKRRPFGFTMPWYSVRRRGR